MTSLRNLEKVISASRFAAKTHNFHLSSYGVTFHPASFYFSSRDQVLKSDHSHDPFTLALLSSELTRENRNLSYHLQSLQDSKQEALKEEINAKVLENSAFIRSYNKELALELKTKSFQFPVDTCANAIYAFEHNGQSNKELYQQVLFPVIREKLGFISFEGLAKLVSGLVQAKSFEDKTLLTAVLGRLREKINERAGREFVQYNAWKLDRYEQIQKKKAESSSEIENLKEKTSGSFGSLKHWLRVNWAFLQNNLLFRVFYRETRVQRQFEEATEEEVVGGLIADLEKLSELEPSVNVKDLVEGLKKK